jgi:hypothetical protein
LEAVLRKTVVETQPSSDLVTWCYAAVTEEAELPGRRLEVIITSCLFIKKSLKLAVIDNNGMDTVSPVPEARKALVKRRLDEPKHRTGTWLEKPLIPQDAVGSVPRRIETPNKSELRIRFCGW